jgi:hypothetical protein
MFTSYVSSSNHHFQHYPSSSLRQMPLQQRLVECVTKLQNMHPNLSSVNSLCYTETSHTGTKAKICCFNSEFGFCKSLLMQIHVTSTPYNIQHAKK